MRIKSLVIRLENLALTRPYTIAYKTVDSVENVIVQIILENGLCGWGAANPSKYVVGEDVQESWQLLKDKAEYLLAGKDIRTIGCLLQLIQQELADHVGALAALDIALHDVFTKYLGISLVEYLGRSHESLPTSITIGIKNSNETIEEAVEYIERGFTVLKVKLGNSWQEDAERLIKLREQTGEQITIRIDANQGYTAHELIKFYDKIKSLQIELIEQPLPAKSIQEMKQLPMNLRKVIAADESLLNYTDAFHLAEYPAACSIFNIKLMKCGGIANALKIATVAESAKIDLMWGCNDESIISISAALHTAFSCPNTKYIDLDGSLDLAKDVVSGGFILGNGIMRTNGQPGLGVKGIL
jgi:L-Ala-D/L-Glu epimerase / N-acetyl-D-glutamate racemase